MTWPLFFTVPGFRSMHLRHHSKLNSDQDPDWTRRKGKDDWSYPMRPSKLGRILLMDTTGLNLYQNILKLLLPAKDKKLRSDFEKQPRLYYLAMLAFYILIFSVITLTGSWKSFFLYWLVPYFTWLKFIKRLRAVAEHFAIPAGNFQQVTRTTLVNPLTAFFIAPKYINFHAEHHHWPSIPWYHLRQMHEYLQQTNAMPGYGYISSGYFTGVLKECTQECQLCKLNP